MKRSTPIANGFSPSGELLIADCRLIMVDRRFFSRSHTASVSPNQQSEIINPQSSIPRNALDPARDATSIDP
jgi:hypothetical protein